MHIDLVPLNRHPFFLVINFALRLLCVEMTEHSTYIGLTYFSAGNITPHFRIANCISTHLSE